MAKTLTTAMNIRCLCCGTENGSRRLDLGDLNTLVCSECDESFTIEQVKADIARAERLIAWIEQASA